MFRNSRLRLIANTVDSCSSNSSLIEQLMRQLLQPVLYTIKDWSDATVCPVCCSSVLICVVCFRLLGLPESKPDMKQTFGPWQVCCWASKENKNKRKRELSVLAQFVMASQRTSENQQDVISLFVLMVDTRSFLIFRTVHCTLFLSLHLHLSLSLVYMCVVEEWLCVRLALSSCLFLSVRFRL